ncbi:MAG: FlgD immunoglobulin-like domain containing protein [Candidatus Krumholzibacteria bacterium]|nr:FlgD immunoglobulin-like domain containing protein [Candidatus Krumholzibacteria bacterium]
MFRQFSLCLMVLIASSAAEMPEPETLRPPDLPPFRGDTLFFFAAEGPGAQGMPGVGERGYHFNGQNPAGWFGQEGLDQSRDWHVAASSLCAGHGTDMSEALPFDPLDFDNDYALWCGREGPPWWGNPIGYGNDWEQGLKVNWGWAIPGAVSIDFAYAGSIEGDVWDTFRVEVDSLGVWKTVYFNNETAEEELLNIHLELDAADFGGEIRQFRFWFSSDGAWSDEDGLFQSDIGAVWIDNLAVYDGLIPVLQDDFEDGLLDSTIYEHQNDWTGESLVQLREGVEVVNPCWTNETSVWTFYDPETTEPGYPDGVIPYGPPWARLTLESPALEVDQYGNPLHLVYGESPPLMLHYDAYLDFPLSSLLFLGRAFSGRPAGEDYYGPWVIDDTILYFDNPDCHEVVQWCEGIPYDSAFDTEISGVRVQLFVVDMCRYWCEDSDNPPPHTLGALIDNLWLFCDDPWTPVVEEVPPLRLHEPHPNPFNPQTEIRFELSKPGQLELQVYDEQGRLLRVLESGLFPSGPGRTVWDGRDDRGQPLPSGVYFVRMESQGSKESCKAVLIR